MDFLITINQQSQTVVAITADDYDAAITAANAGKGELRSQKTLSVQYIPQEVQAEK